MANNLPKRFDWQVAPVLALVAGALFVLETARPLRRRVQERKQHLKLNAGLAATALPALRLVLVPALVQAARFSQKHNLGLLRWLPLPKVARHLLAFLLLDYGNYLWHVLNHRLPLLWRLHNVHHTDLDLDLTTAWRFHTGEVLASVIFRGGMVAAIGANPGLVLVYEGAYEGCNAFHHSNLRLPIWLERLLCRFLVTPRMHGIHHSIVKQETGSNFSVIFTFWDRLHHTLRLNVPQAEIIIGNPAYQNPEEQTISKLLLMPFSEQQPWRLENGEEPARRPEPNKTRLLE